jgi:hypothetical protein
MRLERKAQARRRALDLKAFGRTDDDIRRDPLVVRALGRPVSARRVRQLMSVKTLGDKPLEDVEEVQRTWCRHLDEHRHPEDRQLWDAQVFPRLLARLQMGEPDWVYRVKPLHPRDAVWHPWSGSLRDWRRDVRNTILRHLFATRWPHEPISEAGLGVRAVAESFDLSPRTVCRVLRQRNIAL